MPDTRALGTLLLIGCLAHIAAAQTVGSVVDELKISPTSGAGFAEVLPAGAAFGTDVATLDDLDGNGVPELAVGAPGMDTVFILFMETDGTVLSVTPVGGPTGSGFGTAVESIRLHNGDLYKLLVVGAPLEVDGEIRLYEFDEFGSPSSFSRIEASTELSNPVSEFGYALQNLGDLNGDGSREELAVGAPDGTNKGTVVIIFFDGNGSMDSEFDLVNTGGASTSGSGNRYGSSLASGDFNFDGNGDVLIAAPLDDSSKGRLHFVHLNSSGSNIKSEVELPWADIGVSISGAVEFGTSLTNLGDLDQDGVPDLAVGTSRTSDVSSTENGAAFVLFMGKTPGSEGFASEIPNTLYSTGGDDDGFGRGLATVSPAGVPPWLVVGVPGDDDGGTDTGAIWILDLQDPPPDGLLEATSALRGRPGRATSAVTPGPEIPDPPVVVTPNLTLDEVEVSELAIQDENLGFLSLGSFGTGEAPTEAATGDFDDDVDHIPDIVTSNKEAPGIGDGTISFLPGSVDGDGKLTFGTNVDYPTIPLTDGLVTLEPGDFGADGRLDVLAAGGQRVTLFTNTGVLPGSVDFMDTTVTASLLFPATDLAVGQLDGFPGLDALVATGQLADPTEGGLVRVLTNSGGLLIPGLDFATGQAVASVLIADFDQDTDNDALITVHTVADGPGFTPQSRIELWTNDGSANFGLTPAWTHVVTGLPPTAHPTYGTLTNLDGNAYPDVVFTTSASIAIDPAITQDIQPPLFLLVLKNDMTSAPGFVVSTIGTSYSGLGLAPIIADIAPPEGVLDLILVWYQNILAGTGAAKPEYETYLALLVGDGDCGFLDPAPNQFLTGNAPGDGAVGQLGDIAIPLRPLDSPPAGPVLGGGSGGGLGSVGFGGTLGGGRAKQRGTPPFTPSRDGLDLIIPNINDDTLTLLFGDNAGSIKGSKLIGSDVDGFDPDDLGTFPVGAGIAWTGGPREVLLSDLDEDGDLDLVVSSLWQDTSPLGAVPDVRASIRTYRNEGGNVFVPARLLRLQDGADDFGGDIAVADVVGSTAPDLVVMRRLGSPAVSELQVYTGLGNATFDRTALVSAAPVGLTLSGGVVAFDVDGDLDTDLVTTAIDGQFAGRLIVYDNDDLADSFTAAPDLVGDPIWGTIRSMEVSEVTGDLLIDVVIGAADGKLYIAEGEPLGTFAASTTSGSSAVVGGGALRLADLNADGALDIVSSNSAASSTGGQAVLKTLMALDIGGFAVTAIEGLGASNVLGPVRPIVGDLDGDGKSDVVLAHGESNTISILLAGQPVVVVPLGP